jgi:hypothetical protein
MPLSRILRMFCSALFTLSLPPGRRGEGGMMGLWISGWGMWVGDMNYG